MLVPAAAMHPKPEQLLPPATVVNTAGGAAVEDDVKAYARVKLQVAELLGTVATLQKAVQDLQEVQQSQPSQVNQQELVATVKKELAAELRAELFQQQQQESAAKKVQEEVAALQEELLAQKKANALLREELDEATSSAKAVEGKAAESDHRQDEEEGGEVEITFGFSYSDESPEGVGPKPPSSSSSVATSPAAVAVAEAVADVGPEWVTVEPAKRQQQQHPVAIGAAVAVVPPQRTVGAAAPLLPAPAEPERWLNKANRRQVRDVKEGEVYRGRVSGVLSSNGSGGCGGHKASSPSSLFVTIGDSSCRVVKDGLMRLRGPAFHSFHSSSSMGCPLPEVGDWCMVRVKRVDAARQKLSLECASAFVRS